MKLLNLAFNKFGSLFRIAFSEFYEHFTQKVIQYKLNNKFRYKKSEYHSILNELISKVNLERLTNHPVYLDSDDLKNIFIAVLDSPIIIFEAEK